MAAFPLSVSISADIAKYQQGLRQVVSDARRASAQMSGAFSQATHSAGSFFERIKRDASSTLALMSQHRVAIGSIVGASVAAGAAIVSVTRKAATYADEMGKAAQQTGVGVQALSGLRYAAELADVTFSELNRALTQSSRTVLRAAEGNQEAQRAFAALGISIRDQNGALRSNDEILLAVADRFHQMRDGVEKTAIAQKVFGESGARLIPLLNGGREAIAAYTSEARKLGLEVTPQAAQAAEQFNDNMTRLDKAVQGAQVVIGNSFIPTALKMLDVLGRLGGIQLEGAAARALEGPIALLDKQIAAAEERLKRLGSHPLLKSQRDVLSIQIEGLRRDRRDLEEQLIRLQSPGPSVKPVEPPIVDSGATKAQDTFKTFLDGIRKQIFGIRQEMAELQFGPLVSLGMELDRAFEAAGGEKIKGGRAEFEKLRDEIMRVTDELRIAKFEADRLDEAAGRDSQDSAEWLSFAEDVEKVEEAARKARREFERMRDLQIGEAFSQDSAEWLSVSEDVARVAKDQASSIEATYQNLASTMLNGWRTTLEGIMLGTQSWGQGIKNLFRNIGVSLLEGVTEKLATKPLADALERVLEPVRKSLESFFKNLGNDISTWLSQMFSGLFSGGGGLSGLFSGAGGGWLSSIGTWIGSFLPFEKGGLVPSPVRPIPRVPITPRLSFAGGGEVPAVLHSGEFVLNRRAVNRFGLGTLEAMNAMPDNRPLPSLVTAGMFGGGSQAQPRVEVYLNNPIDPKKMGLSEKDVVTIYINGMKTDGPIRTAARESLRI